MGMESGRMPFQSWQAELVLPLTHGPYAPFPVEEYRPRLARMRAVMAEEAIDALLLTAKENVVYFSGIQTIGWEAKHRPLGLIVPADNRGTGLGGAGALGGGGH